MLAALARLFRKPPPEPQWVEVTALRRQLAEAPPPLVVDVRGADEFDGPLGHIDGARNIPLGELAGYRGEIAAVRRPVVCVCLTDKRSAAAAAQLAAAGVDQVSVLRGGMKAWREAGP
ncbi:MAG TPA: rhodanese-like domain-containing protein [Stellaceae bacterium]|nr:rhodanese-like domain-containing protein [Stellaceae bacterium]